MKIKRFFVLCCECMPHGGTGDQRFPMLQILPQETNGFLCYKDGATSVNIFSDFTINNSGL